MKWIIGIAVAALIAFGVYQWKQGDSTITPTAKSGSDTATAKYAPADTIYFSNSHTTEELAAFFADYYFLGTPGSQAKMLYMATQLSKDSEKPALAFAHYLLNKFQAERDGTLQSFMDFFSLSLQGNAAFFSHGLMPVLKMPLADKGKLEALLNEASSASGMQNLQQDLDGHSVYLWPLGQESGEQAIYLALLANDNFVTLTLVRGSDSPELRKERLGITLPQRSLADSGELAEIESRYDFTKGSTGFIHLQRLAAAFITPDTSLLGREIKALLAESDTEALENSLTPECAKEYSDLASATPRLVAGYRKLGVENDKLAMDFSATLEVSSELIKSEFAKMRGHVSSHVLQADEQIFGISYGLNLDQLAPALTNLWTSFTQKTFQCEALVEAQTKLREMNPMMIGAVFGMAQGVKGVGFSLYDIEFADGPVPSDLSALLSVAAENPSALAALTAMAPFPELASLQIPADGTPVRLTLPMVPPEIELFAAIKGKHLVVYIGDTASRVSETLAQESLDPNGFFGLSINYAKMAGLMESVDPTSLTMMNAAAASPADCAAQFEMLDTFAGISGEFSILNDLDENGFDISMSGTMDKPNYPIHSVSGQYRAEIMNDFCQWQEAGTGTFEMDGKGQLSHSHFSGECAIREESFDWQQLGVRLEFSNRATQSRESCTEEFSTQAQENEPSVCFMIQSLDNGFVCQSNPLSDESRIVRYTKTN